jgi:hypothetical protein
MKCLGVLGAVVIAVACASPAPAAVAGAAGAPGQVTIWVSPLGGDRGDGSRALPYRSLEQARIAVRAARRHAPRARVRVYLLAGTYRLARPLTLDWRDSGRPGADVIWSAAPGARPAISGAIRVAGWKLHDRRLGIYEAGVPAGSMARELYVNGRRAVRARTPSYPAGFQRDSTGFIAPTAAMASWPDRGQLEAVTLTQWKMMRCPVAAVRRRQIVMRQPCWRNVNVFPRQWSFQTLTWLENAYELLDATGEWYLDQAAGRLFYRPRRGDRLRSADVELPRLEALVDVRGTLSHPVSHIRFHGLTFAYATWLDPSGRDGYADDQSGFHLDGFGHPSNVVGHDPDTMRTPGDVRLAYARNVTFDHDDFRHLGGGGLDFATGSQNDTVRGNRFADVSAAAVQLGAVSRLDAHPRRAAQLIRDNLIADNVITQTGREYQDVAAINIGFTTRSTVEHNEISDVPWSGISIGWGWGLLDPGGYLGLPGAVLDKWGRYTELTASRGNRILDNRISRFLQVLWDGGAIYTVARQGRSLAGGELISGNVARDKRRLAGSNVFYTDGGSRFVTLKHNVSLNNPIGVTDFGPCGLPDSSLGCSIRGPYGSDRGGCRPYGDLTYRENYWQHPAMYVQACPYPPYPVNLVDIQNHVVSGPGQVPRSILNAAGLEPAYRGTVGARG